MTYNHCPMSRHIQVPGSRYQVDLRPQTRENGQKPHFFCSFCTIHALYACVIIMHNQWPPTHVKKHLGLPWYAISSESETPNLRKLTKTSFLALFRTINAHYAHLFNCAWPITTARCWKIFRTIIICNTESIRATRVKKMAKTYFSSFLHNLCTLCIPD